MALLIAPHCANPSHGPFGPAALQVGPGGTPVSLYLPTQAPSLASLLPTVSHTLQSWEGRLFVLFLSHCLTLKNTASVCRAPAFWRGDVVSSLYPISIPLLRIIPGCNELISEKTFPQISSTVGHVIQRHTWWHLAQCEISWGKTRPSCFINSGDDVSMGVKLPFYFRLDVV